MIILNMKYQMNCINAGSEADQVHQELLALFLGLDHLDVLNLVHPLEAEVSLCLNRRNVLDRSESSFALFHVGDVIIEQRQIELNMQGLFVQLTREVHPRLWAVDMAVQVQHQVVRDD